MLDYIKSVARSAAIVVAVAMGSAAPLSATTIGNAPTGNAIGIFGTPDTQTYGQVFTAPVTGTLDSFTLYLNGPVGNVVGAIGTWNGTSTFGLGFGSPTTLFQSASVASAAGPLTFSTGGVAVTENMLYVAFLTAFGLNNPPATTRMPLGTDAAGINYFVFNNGSNPFNNAAWNYFSGFGDVQFEARFTEAQVNPIPLPAAGWLMVAALGALGFAGRGRSAA